MCSKILVHFGVTCPDVVKSFDPESWIEASVISQCFVNRPKIVAGNYLPNVTQFNKNPLRDTRSRLIYRYFTKVLDSRNRLFIGHEQLRNFRSRFGEKIDAQVWFLPVDIKKYQNTERTPQYGALVSVGRLAPMKEYCFYMVEVVGELRRKGFQVTWDVYGDGIYEEEISKFASKLGLTDSVRLRGRLPYGSFPQAMGNAFAFIGMGTSAIEAAACGVPSIVAIAHDRSGMTYGRISRLPLGNVGDRVITPPELRVVEEIENLLTMSDIEYQRAVQEDRDYVGRYDMDEQMKSFMKLVSYAAPAPTDAVLLAVYNAHFRLERLRIRLSKCVS